MYKQRKIIHFILELKIECPGSFPPTMPCTSGVRFTEEVLCRGPESLRGEEGGRQADGDREYRRTTQESGTLTPDNMGGPGWAGHSSALKGQSAGCNVSSYRRHTTAANKR